jgi:hypothetical protein
MYVVVLHTHIGHQTRLQVLRVGSRKSNVDVMVQTSECIEFIYEDEVFCSI